MRYISSETLLPHRYPFLLVDRILEFEKDVSIRGLKYMSANNRMPLASSPLLIGEALAQLSKALETLSNPQAMAISFLAQINLDFLGPIPADAALELSARKERQQGEMVCYAVTAEADGETIVRGRLFRRRNA